MASESYSNSPSSCEYSQIEATKFDKFYSEKIFNDFSEHHTISLSDVNFVPNIEMKSFHSNDEFYTKLLEMNLDIFVDEDYQKL